jgi:hypothetical protein
MQLRDLEHYASARNNDKIHITDSYRVYKNEILPIIQELRAKYPLNKVLNNRSDSSLKYEWLTHTLLYKMGICKERTKDLGLEYPQSWILKVGYRIIGFIAQLILN